MVLLCEKTDLVGDTIRIEGVPSFLLRYFISLFRSGGLKKINCKQVHEVVSPDCRGQSLTKCNNHDDNKCQYLPRFTFCVLCA